MGSFPIKIEYSLRNQGFSSVATAIFTVAKKNSSLIAQNYTCYDFDLGILLVVYFAEKLLTKKCPLEFFSG